MLPQQNTFSSGQTEKFFGKYRGVVLDNQDPLEQGRLKLSVPAVLGTLTSNWALPCLPYSGKDQGTFVIPPVDAHVWVEFEGGDVRRPIWVGGFFPNGDKPTDNTGNDASPTLKVIKTTSGMMLTFNDDSQELHLSDENGNNMLEIKVQDGTVTLKGATKVIVEAPQIEIVENATEPVVFGNQLFSYLTQLKAIFDSHMHPGQQAGPVPVTPAPPTPPLPSPSQGMLSNKVKSG